MSEAQYFLKSFSAALCIVLFCSLYGRVVLSLCLRNSQPLLSVSFFCGLLLVSATRWFLFLADLKYYTFGVTLAISAFVVLFMLIVFRKRIADNLLVGWSTWIAIFPASILGIISIAVYLNRIHAGNIGMYTLANADAFYLFNISNFLTDPSSVLNGFQIDYSGELKNDVFGIIALISYFAHLTGDNVVAVPGFIGIVSTLFCVALVEILQFARVPLFFAFCLGLLFVTSPLCYYISGHFFAGQMLSWCTFLSLLAVNLRDNVLYSIERSVVFCIFCSFQILFYPAFLIPLLVVHVTMLLTVALPSGKVLNIIKCMAYQAMLPLLVGVFVFYSKAMHSFDQVFAQATTGVQGWPLPVISFISISALPSYALFAESYRQIQIISYVIAVVCSMCIAIKPLLRRNSTFDPIVRLSCVYAVCVLIYVVYSTLSGDTYRQWKLGTMLVFPLYFFIPLLLFSMLNKFSDGKLVALILSSVLVLLSGLNIMSINNLHETSSKGVLRPILFPVSYYKLGQVNDDTTISSVYLRLRPYAETMLAMNFLYKKKLYVVSKSYFDSKVMPDTHDLGKTVYIQDSSCLNISSGYLLSNNFSVSSLGFAEKQPYLEIDKVYDHSSMFDKESCIETYGLSASNFGIWAQPEGAYIDFSLRDISSDFTLIIEGSGFTNPKFKPIGVDIKLNGHLIGHAQFSSIENTERLSVHVPRSIIASGINRLEFVALNTYSLKDLGVSTQDESVHGFVLKSVVLSDENCD